METTKCSCEKIPFSCETCNKINETEHLVSYINRSSGSDGKHYIMMKTLPGEGEIYKAILCVESCFVCLGRCYNRPEQEMYDAHRMYTRLSGDKKEEMKNSLLQCWRRRDGLDSKEIFDRYESDIPVMKCTPVVECTDNYRTKV